MTQQNEPIDIQVDAPKKAVQKVQPLMPTQTDEVQMLISQAINNNTPVETMEKLLAMRRELRAEKAKEAFDQALSNFQSECPVIEKRKKVYEKGSTTKVRYSFSPLDDIVEQVKPFLGKNGLSYTFKTIQTDKVIGIICKATHKMGHSEETEFSVPIGSESFMSEVQKFGARITFAKRYAFCNAFGILTGDEDIDANIQDKPSSVGIENDDVSDLEGADTLEMLLSICTRLKKKYPKKLQTLVGLYNYKKKQLEEIAADELAQAADKDLNKGEVK